MKSSKQIRLTAAEPDSLWAQYVSDGASRCMLLYFKEVIEDKEVKNDVLCIKLKFIRD
ncbi:hypothetical protein P9F13_15190 [Alkalihalophilus marmarensis]|nr:hypothetical protein [Alkalihalophilus marmarensis]MEC2073261.1 hypothetical protein [Alkalihalophilus marmarensis]